jgi:hypothetical protein
VTRPADPLPFREGLRRQYLWTDETGQRRAGWRVPFFIWLVPVLFAVAAVLLAAQTLWRQSVTVPTTGEVVRVYDWDGDYGPVYRYTWTDGTETEATAGVSSPNWNFPIGSTHPIRYFPGEKRDVVLEGPHNWFVAGVIGAIALGLGLISLYAQLRLWRWLRGGDGLPRP